LASEEQKNLNPESETLALELKRQSDDNGPKTIFLGQRI
jgi:hypothetical protein